MTVKEFWDSKDKLAIHCDTEEKANKLLAKFDELGKKWCSDRSYMERNNYRTYLDLTCYDNRGGVASNNFYSNFGYQVIEFDDLDDFKQEKPKETIMKEETKTNCKFKVGDIAVANELSNKYGLTNKRNNYEGKVTEVSSDGFIRLDNEYIVNEECFDLKLKSKILDNVEFDYLWNIIKPFKDKVEYIKKDIHYRGYFIRVVLKDMDSCCLPYFPKDSSMYKGMEADEQYTLEELGFVEPKPTFKFKVGDIVKVVDMGYLYPDYYKWTGLTPELEAKLETDTIIDLNREYIIRKLDKHEYNNDLLYALESIDNKVYIVGEKGLKLIKEKR